MEGGVISYRELMELLGTVPFWFQGAKKAGMGMERNYYS